MLRRNRAAVTSSRKENATCPTTSALLRLSRRGFGPRCGRIPSAPRQAGARRASAGTVPNRNPVASREQESVAEYQTIEPGRREVLPIREGR